MAKQVIVILAILASCSSVQADCRHFFRKQVVVQQVAVPYVAPVVYAPLVFYQAGDELRIQAAVKRELEYQQQLQAPVKGYQAPQQAPVQAPIQAPVKGGTLEPLQNVQVGVFAKCTRCHTGPEAAGGLVLDGQTPVDTHAVYRWGQIAGQGRDVPAKMAALIGSMSPEEKGRLNDALLDLVAIAPRPVQPVPPPAPEPGGLQ